MRCLYYPLITLAIVATPSYAVETGTRTIHYYFGLNVSSGGSSGPVTPENCTNSCSGSTPDQRAYPDCTCYCAEKDCSNGYVFDSSSCSCVISCQEGVDNDGNCCPAPGYDAANCITKETNANGCEVYVSNCESPRVCDGAGACVCPDATPIWTGSDCVECVLNADCPSEKPLCENNACVNKCADQSVGICQQCEPLTGQITNLTGLSCGLNAICKNGSCISTGGGCPSGTVECNGKCYDPTCSEGQTWDYSSCSCVDDEPVCPDGHVLCNDNCVMANCTAIGESFDYDICACKCNNGGVVYNGECRACEGEDVLDPNSGLCVSPCEVGGVYCEQGWCCNGICCPEGTMHCDAGAGLCCEGPIADKASAN